MKKLDNKMPAHAQYKLWDISDYELPPPPPASTHPSHHNKVVDDESLSGLYTHLSHSGKVINEEPSSGQYTQTKFTTMLDIIPEDNSRVGIHEDPSYLDILSHSTLPIHSEFPAMVAQIYEDPSRISLTEDPFQLPIPISHSAIQQSNPLTCRTKKNTGSTM